MLKLLSWSQSIFIIIVLFAFTEAYAGSGGQLSPEQAAYDVSFYDLDLTIDPSARTIAGSLLYQTKIINSIDRLILNLDIPFKIDSVLFKKNDGAYLYAEFKHSHSVGRVRITYPLPVTIGDRVTVKIFYNGIPRKASNPPRDSGFVWRRTASGNPWIGVTCEDEGADIWWPCNDKIIKGQNNKRRNIIRIE